MRVWIEIKQSKYLESNFEVSPSYEGVDWNRKLRNSIIVRWVSPSYEGVDWNLDFA